MKRKTKEVDPKDRTNIPVYEYDGCEKNSKTVEVDGYRYPLITKQGPLVNRLIIGIPMTGLVRAEWVLSRYGQVIPCNWSASDVIQYIDQFSPINFMVADARNIIATTAVENDFEWILFIDHDVMLVPGFFLRVNERLIEKKVPVWSGLYFTKSLPAEPLIYRNTGGGFFADWKLGDEVWCTGIPMGCTVIHVSILKAMYEDAEQYKIGDKIVRRIFMTPAKTWFDPELLAWQTNTGTEDLNWCARVKEGNYFKKAGWDKYQEMENPFMVDTSLFCRHIDQSGRQYPTAYEESAFIKRD